MKHLFYLCFLLTLTFNYSLPAYSITNKTLHNNQVEQVKITKAQILTRLLKLQNIYIETFNEKCKTNISKICFEEVDANFNKEFGSELQNLVTKIELLNKINKQLNSSLIPLPQNELDSITNK